jgi:hypothetical protein
LNITCSGLLHLLLWKDSGPLQTLRNQFFRERLQMQIDMEASIATSVGLSASTQTVKDPMSTRTGTAPCNYFLSHVLTITFSSCMAFIFCCQLLSNVLLTRGCRIEVSPVFTRCDVVGTWSSTYHLSSSSSSYPTPFIFYIKICHFCLWPTPR